MKHHFQRNWIGYVLPTIMALSLVMGLSLPARAQTVLNTASVKMGWDVYASSAPAVNYDYAYKLSPQTIPSAPLGTVTMNTATIPVPPYGTYAFCVRTNILDAVGGNVKATSPWSCSDTAASCQGGVTFVDSFWPVPPALTGLKTL